MNILFSFFKGFVLGISLDNEQTEQLATNLHEFLFYYPLQHVKAALG